MSQIKRIDTRRAGPAREPRLSSATDRPSRGKLLKRRARRFLRPLIWAGILLLGFGGVMLIGRQAAGHASVITWRDRLGAIGALAGLQVEQVKVEGRLQTPAPLVDAAIGVIPGEPMLGFSVSEARARLESLAWVQSATVSRLLPGTIVVDLVERRPYAVWQNQGKFTLVDRDGRPVPDQDIGTFGQLPLIVGSGAPAAASVLLDALAGYPQIRAHVVAAVRVGDRRWNLHLTNGGDVYLPEGQAPAALARLDTLQRDHALLDRPLQVIDLRLPDRLMVRPQQETPAADGADPKAADPKTADSKPADPKAASAHVPTPAREIR